MAEWIYGIVAVMLFGTVILQVLPSGTYRKYVRLFLGAMLMITVMWPVFSWLGFTEGARVSFEQELYSSWLSNEIGWGKSGSSEILSQDEWTQNMHMQMRNRQQIWVKEAAELTARDYGFVCLDCQVEWNETENWPSKILLWVARDDDQTDTVQTNTISVIHQVTEVDKVGADAKEEKVYYEPSELRPLHQALQTVWQLEEAQILLYLQR